MNDDLIRDLTIDGFRAFEHFEMHDLGRVNLLVGKNNCGKSSVLEAVQIASSYGDSSELWSILSSRGEVSWDESENHSKSLADVTHLFHGHSIPLEQKLSIKRRRISSNDVFEATIKHYDRHLAESVPRPFRDNFTDDRERLALRLSWQNGQPNMERDYPLENGRYLTRSPVAWTSPNELNRQNVIVVPTNALRPFRLVELFDEFSLTPMQGHVLQALRAVEPRIEQIAPRPLPNNDAPGGFWVKLDNEPDRIPIGSLGAGIWRMLGLSLALAKSAGGILLVDEIDTGLHYSVMEKMWKLVYEGAKRLNVQVFATTHSRDCYESLAAIALSDEHAGGGADVTIQRIERSKGTAVAFTGGEIVVAAERELEVR